ncbi:unnamed protein product [Danaus chrysippus]|uniref:(African queen) hypothetical protein n=1 Tax=Danaus chrysippus TaxID=151541 RepID=A0A8J2R386_9NEOP|nr:unnamed protein product [Danaus chrysippus]
MIVSGCRGFPPPTPRGAPPRVAAAAGRASGGAGLSRGRSVARCRPRGCAPTSARRPPPDRCLPPGGARPLAAHPPHPAAPAPPPAGPSIDSSCSVSAPCCVDTVEHLHSGHEGALSILSNLHSHPCSLPAALCYRILNILQQINTITTDSIFYQNV